MAGFLSLVFLGTFMFVACMAVQLFPLKTQLSPKMLQKALALSIGMLVGTAIAVVVPEGVELLVEGKDLLLWRVPVLFVIGCSILMGFMVMYLVDHHQVIKNRFFPELMLSKVNDTSFGSIVQCPLTLSLILHSTTDGFALGVTSVDELLSMHYIFYSMIILHKLPTAFSLSTVLVQKGLSERLCYAHFLAFAAATPIALILAYPLARISLTDHSMLAVLLLFSSGTFLYSVVHLVLDQPPKDDPESISVNIPEQNDDFLNLVLTMCGTLVPLLFSLAGVD
ncbi:hypothetical protein PUMCH_000717 [Australozyma saopauloensis]|uniref:Uncharacterized protein n=1 Tax=Australozyma saopauloensis TaxID=291208 RepID=A0AAX4H4L1_9ASCO|nr:hypothetical protein PUMCH_000717 [[Candida] saopauloensis]